MLWTASFKDPLDKAYQQAVNQLQNHASLSLDQIRRITSRCSALRYFKDHLADFTAGRSTPQSVCRSQTIKGRSYLVLEEGPWRGYFTNLGAPPVLTGVLFVDATVSASAVKKQLRALIKSKGP